MPDVMLASGLRLSYGEWGDVGDPVLVLVPGPTDSWRSYQPVADALSEEFHVIAVSQRGHGHSDKPARDYGIAVFANDLREFLDALAIQAALLIGHSGSCPVLRRLTLDHPSRVTGMVLESAPTTLRGHPPLVEFVDSVVNGLNDPIGAEFARSFLTDTSSTDLAPGLIDVLVEDLLKVPAQVWKEMFGDLAEYEDTLEIPLIQAPTLLLWGDADALVPRAMQDRLRDSLPNAELIVYPGIGHTPRWEDSGRFAADVTTFAHRVTKP